MKLALKTLVYRVGGVKSSGCRGMEVRIKANICCRFLWGGVGMERPVGAVDEKNLRI